MDRYGKVSFYLNESYCQIELYVNGKNKYYKFNKKESSKFFNEILKHNDIFYLNKNKNRNTVILNDEEQLETIFNIIKENKFRPKETIHKAKKEFLTKVAAVVTAVSISTTGLLMLKNTQKKSVKPEIKKQSIAYIQEGKDKYDNNILIPSWKSEIDSLEELKKLVQDAINEVNSNTFKEVSDDIKETSTLNNEVINEFDLENIDINDYDYMMFNEVMNKYYMYFEKYGKMYGIDPYLIAMIACQESSGNHKKEANNNIAIGLCQIEKKWSVVDVLDIPAEEFVAEKANDYISEKATKVYNYETQSYDYLVGATEYSMNTFKYFDVKIDDKYTVLNLKNVSDNIRMCAGILAHNLKELDGNLFAALVSYNQGLPEVKKYIKEYAKENGISESNAIRRNNWIKFIPNYYGDARYYNNVLKFAIAGNNQIHCTTGENSEIKNCTLIINGNNIRENNMHL